MIVYYQKSTKRILSIVNHNSKKHLNDNELKAELNSMFPNMIDDVGVSRFDKEVEAICGGTWDEKTNKQIAPPPAPQPHPDKARLEELKGKFETGTATLIEVQEYLSKRDG